MAAGISPGPLLFWTITSTLRSGTRAGVIVACAPLLSDLVVVGLTLAILGQLPETALAAVGVVGGLLTTWLGVRTWQGAPTASLAIDASERVPVVRTLGRAATINLLSPHPWIAWGTALGPLALATWRDDRVAGVWFVVAFYALLVGAKVAVALLVGASRHRLGDAGYRRALRVAALLLAAVGVVMVVEFGYAL